MDDITVKKRTGKNGYYQCQVRTIKPDELDNDVAIYISSHFYHGHSNMKIEHLRLVHSTLGEFFKKYDKALDEADFPAGVV